MAAGVGKVGGGNENERQHDHFFIKIKSTFGVCVTTYLLTYFMVQSPS